MDLERILRKRRIGGERAGIDWGREIRVFKKWVFAESDSGGGIGEEGEMRREWHCRFGWERRVRVLRLFRQRGIALFSGFFLREIGRAHV